MPFMRICSNLAWRHAAAASSSYVAREARQKDMSCMHAAQAVRIFVVFGGS